MVRRVARISIAARGVVYLVLAYLTVEVARRNPSAGRADSSGVLVHLDREFAGTELVILLGVGFLAYAAWRLLQAISGDGGDDGRSAAKRLGWAAIGVVYLGLCAQAAEVAVAGRAGRQDPTAAAAHVIALPGGRALLFVAGLAVVAGGVGLAVWAALQKFELYLPDRRLPAWVDPLARVAGTFGNVTRGLVFAAVGCSLAVAAVTADAADAKGISAALHTMIGHPMGAAALGLVAAGFAAFAVTSVVEALYRDM